MWKELIIVAVILQLGVTLPSGTDDELHLDRDDKSVVNIMTDKRDFQNVDISETSEGSRKSFRYYRHSNREGVEENSHIRQAMLSVNANSNDREMSSDNVTLGKEPEIHMERKEIQELNSDKSDGEGVKKIDVGEKETDHEREESKKITDEKGEEEKEDNSIEDHTEAKSPETITKVVDDDINTFLFTNTNQEKLKQSWDSLSLSERHALLPSIQFDIPQKRKERKLRRHVMHAVNSYHDLPLSDHNPIIPGPSDDSILGKQSGLSPKYFASARYQPVLEEQASSEKSIDMYQQREANRPQEWEDTRRHTERGKESKGEEDEGMLDSEVFSFTSSTQQKLATKWSTMTQEEQHNVLPVLPRIAILQKDESDWATRLNSYVTSSHNSPMRRVYVKDSEPADDEFYQELLNGRSALRPAKERFGQQQQPLLNQPHQSQQSSTVSISASSSSELKDSNSKLSLHLLNEEEGLFRVLFEGGKDTDRLLCMIEDKHRHALRIIQRSRGGGNQMTLRKVEKGVSFMCNVKDGLAGKNILRFVWNAFTFYFQNTHYPMNSCNIYFHL